MKDSWILFWKSVENSFSELLLVNHFHLVSWWDTQGRGIDICKTIQFLFLFFYNIIFLFWFFTLEPCLSEMFQFPFCIFGPIFCLSTDVSWVLFTWLLKIKTSVEDFMRRYTKWDLYVKASDLRCYFLLCIFVWGFCLTYNQDWGLLGSYTLA